MSSWPMYLREAAGSRQQLQEAAVYGVGGGAPLDLLLDRLQNQRLHRLVAAWVPNENISWF